MQIDHQYNEMAIKFCVILLNMRSKNLSTGFHIWYTWWHITGTTVLFRFCVNKLWWLCSFFWVKIENVKFSSHFALCSYSFLTNLKLKICVSFFINRKINRIWWYQKAADPEYWIWCKQCEFKFSAVKRILS